MSKKRVKKWAVASAASVAFLASQGTASAAASHKVVKGDTLWGLGQQNGVTVDELKGANNRQNDMIYVGETLTIPDQGQAQSAASPATSVHTVAQGETLYHIATQNGMTVDQLKAVNGLQSDIITIGQTLKLQGEAPAPAQTAPSTSVSAQDQDLLARLVEAEAKGEPYQGKVAVAIVVLNRVASPEFPNSIHDVIYQQLGNGVYQFSPVANGAINQPASEESKRAVSEALSNPHENDALFFYNPKIAESQWVATQQVTAVIGNHVFAK
ncbi:MULTISPECIES: cell wall hydrolase [Priestia]|uniref:Spore cortex-lytic enzyme n=1 Tax=Priestia megaterium Q3 TaxID=1452722 RepID=A0A806U812_PRIMG|nr:MULTISPECIES: cell wall hydrolase [Priestia]NHH96395.1 Spore cortex-lytic enzyme [Bacillus sp. MB95]AKP78263.1 Spore cortex-lytic enzyme precursor [Priestia megaterium Q3]KZE14218.1 spore cortex-lytic protein [Priestia aryabhattai]MCM2975564.1 cell wall hydrolase [Priestia aryabhattai]MDT0145251.1 cell wall hydrolase [Priestia aryabhattai]